MEGEFVPWDKPPNLDNMQGHAGEFPNCRCYPEPVIPKEDGKGVYKPSLPTAAQERKTGKTPLSQWEKEGPSRIFSPTPPAPANRPGPVKDFAELAQGIRALAGGHLKNSAGFTSITLNNEHAFMSTNSRGGLWISQKPHILPDKSEFNPFKNLKDAWNNLSAGKPLDWKEEYAVESLWHEITHNRQIYAPLGDPKSIKRNTAEIVPPWTARRTYPDFLKSLGGEAGHWESIKREGLGYGFSIERFDRLLDTLKINETSMLTEMQRLLDNVPRDKYQKELTAFLAKQSGKAKGDINKAISKIKDRGSDFEELLKELGKNE
jgi:hypothetical protein